MKWFGEQWPSPELPAPVCEDVSERVETPVGERCLYCGEAVQQGAQGVVLPGVSAGGDWESNPVHRVCMLRWTGIHSIVEGQ